MLVQLGFLFSNSEAGTEGSGFGWSQILAFGAVILIMAFMPKIIKRIRRERNALTMQEIKSMHNRPNVRSKADEILVELAEMSREINAQVDTKIRVLNKLLRDAEKAIKRYEELVEKDSLPNKIKTDNADKGIKKSNFDIDKAEIKIASSSSQLKNEIMENKDEEESVSEKDNNSENNETGVWQRSIGVKIQELSKKGYDINDIALKTRMSVSEVTLILEMLKKNK